LAPDPKDEKKNLLEKTGEYGRLWYLLFISQIFQVDFCLIFYASGLNTLFTLPSLVLIPRVEGFRQALRREAPVSPTHLFAHQRQPWIFQKACSIISHALLTAFTRLTAVIELVSSVVGPFSTPTSLITTINTACINLASSSSTSL
jgi:hypothetical protein